MCSPVQTNAGVPSMRSQPDKPGVTKPLAKCFASAARHALKSSDAARSRFFIKSKARPLTGEDDAVQTNQSPPNAQPRRPTLCDTLVYSILSAWSDLRGIRPRRWARNSSISTELLYATSTRSMAVRGCHGVSQQRMPTLLCIRFASVLRTARQKRDRVAAQNFLGKLVHSTGRSLHTHSGDLCLHYSSQCVGHSVARGQRRRTESKQRVQECSGSRPANEHKREQSALFSKACQKACSVG